MDDHSLNIGLGGDGTVLVVYGVTTEAWAKRYGLRPFSYPCVCGFERKSEIPFASGRVRGLAAPKCSACGHEAGAPYCVVAAPGQRDMLALKPRRPLTKKEIRKRPKCPVLPFATHRPPNPAHG